MGNIRSHKEQQERLFELVLDDKLPSSLLFAGVEGIGKQHVARTLAATLLCESDEIKKWGGCKECGSCRLVDSNNHPDLRVLECKSSDDGTTASIRDLLYNLNLRPFRGRRHVAILNDADNLSVQSANILLKNLEEPRPSVVFILIAANPSRLPATILSRCQRWFFDRLSDEDIRTILSQRQTPEASKQISDEMYKMLDGSLANLEDLLEHPENWREISEGLERIFSGDALYGVELAQRLAKDKEALPRILSLMRICGRQKLLEQREDGPSAVWAVFVTNILAAERQIMERNFNPALILSAIFSQLSVNNSDKLTAWPKSVKIPASLN